MFASVGDIVQCMFTDTSGSLSFVPGGICPYHVRGTAYIESRTSLLCVDGTCAMRTHQHLDMFDQNSDFFDQSYFQFALLYSVWNISMGKTSIKVHFK